MKGLPKVLGKCVVVVLLFDVAERGQIWLNQQGKLALNITPVGSNT